MRCELRWSRCLWLGSSGLFTLGLILASEAWRSVDASRAWSFPGDHWAQQDYRVEWWYFTGQVGVEGDEEKRFGYQFTFYRVGLSRELPPFQSDWTSRSLVMGHAAVSDFRGATHHFSELLYRATPLLGGFGRPPDPRIAWSRAPAGTEGRWELRWNGEGFDFEAVDRQRGFGFQLTTRPLKPLVFQGHQGLSRKGKGGASHYYSFTRLETSGSLKVGGREYRVQGVSWMDREISSSILSDSQVGWDWFSLRLRDGRDVMVFQLRDRNGRVDFGRGTLVDSLGTARYLDLSQWRIEVEDRWTSIASGAEYPSRWRLSLPGGNPSLTVVPIFADQENRSRLIPGLAYWEGAVRALSPDGGEIGRGYVELTGYAPGSRPPI